MADDRRPTTASLIQRRVLENLPGRGAGMEAADVAAMPGDAVAEFGVLVVVQSVGEARRGALVEDVVADAAVGQRQQALAVRGERRIGGVGRVFLAVAGEAAAGGAEPVGAIERQARPQPGYAGSGL